MTSDFGMRIFDGFIYLNWLWLSILSTPPPKKQPHHQNLHDTLGQANTTAAVDQ